MGWKIAELGDIGEIQGGLQLSSRRDELALKAPYLRVANVYHDRLDLSEIKMIGLTEDELRRLELRPDDLLLVEGHGNIEEIGRCRDVEWFNPRLCAPEPPNPSAHQSIYCKQHLCQQIPQRKCRQELLPRSQQYDKWLEHHKHRHCQALSDPAASNMLPEPVRFGRFSNTNASAPSSARPCARRSSCSGRCWARRFGGNCRPVDLSGLASGMRDG